MSTILDALKKSEQERKLNQVPTLSDMPVPNEPSRWPTILLLIVIVLLLVLIGFALNQWWSKAASSPVVISNSTTEGGAAPVQASPEDVLVNVVSYSEQAEQRFVMIDGKLFRENDYVRAGLKVEEIRQNEVVLNLRGRRIIRQP